MATRRQIEIRFKGQGLTPEVIRARDLAAILVSLEDAVQEVAKANDIEVQDKAGLCLIGVREGSVALRLQNTDDMAIFDAFDMLLIAFKRTVIEGITQQVAKAKEEIGKFCFLYKCRAELRGKSSQRKPDVVIFPLVEEIVESPAEIRGSTTIKGIVEDAGGATPKAWIRLHYGRVPIDLNKDQAIALGGMLYRKVILDGVATWDSETREIVGFKLKRIVRSCEDVSPSDAFANIAKDFGHIFNPMLAKT